MEYNIRGQHIQVTDAMRDYVEKKLNRLEKYFEAPITSETTVTMSVTKGKHAVEVTIPLSSAMLRAEEKSEDMYASIDLVVDKLDRQIRKHKTKINSKLRKESGIRTLFKDDTAPSVRVLDEEEDYELVRTKRFLLKPMDVEEAILQMNMVGHSFFMFANSDTKEVNVVYKRSDGRYGLLESD
ncbi:ribosomal subunit interface protein [Paenibacillus baekrokdamisoli]|uniref:Ribosome hibernation promoting factor n=1 Tax=Paenibacillus baekrokdamisoli TaxID=1712516 RepID=A0A3G9JDE2_9BACL|nr:ribosome-associated translation inhibitor RaiA [Paenibacillus baekrokdamisoli]MBB3069107.1 putative sigma-54 modulation protein [Paenibacillus baekrokdamisoli]BBH23921.1 ribosomal subunit interface protein [Paenibacillus baekrokdamisoli]